MFPELPTGKYVEALRHLESIENTSERRHEALSIYRKANRDLTYKPGKDAPPPPDWFEIFLNEAVFLTQADTPQAKHEHLYANDAPEIAALFAGDASVELLAVPSNEVPRLSRLLEEAGVQRLSTAVNTKIINLGDEAQDVELTERVRNSSLQLSRVLYSTYPAIFEEAVTSGQLKGLQKLEVVKVTELTMLVSLGTNTRTTMAQIAYDAGRVLYREGCLSVRDRLSAELCKFMGASPDLADTFARILSEESHNAIEEFLAVRNIATLPTDLAAEILGHEKLKSSLEDGVVDDSDALSDLEQDSGTSLQQIERKVVRVSEIKPAAVGSEHPAPPFPIEKMKGMPDEPANSPQNSIDESNSASARSADFTPAPVQSGITKTRPATNFQRQPKRIANRTYHSRLGGLRPQAANKDSLQGQANLGDTPQRHTAPTLRSGAFKITSKLNNFRRRKTQSYRASTGRLLSYAIGAETNHQTESTLADHENRVLVERAAVEYFLRTYRQEWAELHEMPVNNAGYDITAITHDGVEEWIEVKGQGSAWTEEGIALTPIELLAAAKKTDNYLLCVVEHALDDTRRKTYLIRNPYGATTQFRFDSGWKAVAARGRGKILEPREGLNIEIPGIGKGCIISAMSKGRFFTIQVKLSTGAIVQKPYNPAKMKLSEGQ